MEEGVRGEVTIVVAGAPTPTDLLVDLGEGRRRVEALVAGGMRRTEAARRVATDTGLSRRELFAREAG